MSDIIEWLSEAGTSMKDATTILSTGTPMRDDDTSMNAFENFRNTDDISTFILFSFTDSGVLPQMNYESSPHRDKIVVPSTIILGLKMTEKEQQKLLEIISEAFCPEDQIHIGAVYENPSPTKQGVWVEINKSKAFFGLTTKAALFTARQADWWYPRRDGNLIQDDFDWFELRAISGSDWKELEPKMMKIESRTRVALNIQMETGIAEDSLPDPTLSQRQTEQTPVEAEYYEDTDCSDEPLQQIELLSVQGWDGLWFLDDTKTTFRKIRLMGTHEGYRVYMGEFLDFEADRDYQTVARFTYDDEDHLVELQILGQKASNPMVVMEQTDDGQIKIKKIELG